LNVAPGQWDIVSSVGLTALGVAAARAIETGRDTPLIRDPWGKRFVTHAQPPVPMPTTPEEAQDAQPPTWLAMADFLAVRSRYFDDYFAAATEAGVTQVVLLAAGLDARAFRLDWPTGCVLFEVDQPQVLEFKETVLGDADAVPGCTRRLVPTDLRDDWVQALKAAGFDSSRPTAWLAEGLLIYLPASAEQQLLDEITHLSAPGSRVAVEGLRDMAALQDHPLLHDREVTAQTGIELKQLISDEKRQRADERLKQHGWELAVETHGEAGQRFGRALDSELGELLSTDGLLISGVLP
jgi:methyltransferase (TIGR00027 family)